MALKKRYWTVIGYPESLPENWKEILTESHLPVCISPLHDKDINESTGEPKKPHYHILIAYDGPTTKENVRQLTDRLNCPMPVPVDSVRGAVRYETHKDNPEKAQYDEKDIITLNGFDLDTFCELTSGEVNKMKKELYVLITEKGFTEYVDLLGYLVQEDLVELFNVASSHTLYTDAILRSARNKAKMNLGEVKKTVQDLVSGYSRALRDTNYSEAWEAEIKRIQKALEEMPF